MNMQADREWLLKMADKDADVDFTIGSMAAAIMIMQQQEAILNDARRISPPDRLHDEVDASPPGTTSSYPEIPDK
jgi:hypothetical protein